MAEAKKIEEYDDRVQAQGGDQFILNSTSNGSYIVNNLTVTGMFSHVPDNVVVSVDKLVIRQSSSNVVPASSNTAATQGTIWYDSNNIYIAVSNTEVKRAALNTF